MMRSGVVALVVGVVAAAGLAVACGGSGTGGDGGPEAGDADSRGQGDGTHEIGAGDGPTVSDGSPGDAATEGASGPDSGGDAAAACSEGAASCQDDATALLCQGGQWKVAQVCGDPLVCLAGACVPPEECQPGFVVGCFSLAARKVCHVSGKGYVPFPCPEGLKCTDGKCGELSCNPGVRQCVDAGSYQQCADDGSGWEGPTACEPGSTCLGGKCLTGCAGDIKYNQSNVGCEFWSVDLGQWEAKPGESQLDPSASTIPHSVVIGNPGEFAAHVTFVVGDGTPVEVPDNEIPAGQSRAFLMPVLSQQVSDINKKSIRVLTDHPVTAAQFNPPNNEDFVHTSDASLLYPVGILGKEYYIVSLPSVIGPEFPIVGKMPSVWGYATVVAVLPGTTTVSMVLTAPTEAGPGLEAYEKGDTLTVDLEQWDVLNVNSLAYDAMVAGPDLTGTHVVTSQPAAVFAGHQCFVVGNSNCDHLETQLLPVEAWGTRYVAGRMDTPAPNEYRVVSGNSGNVLTTLPPVNGLNGKTLNKGDWLHVACDFSFQVEGTGPIQVIQFIAGNSEGGGILVDPSMTNLIPTHQFRSDYPILVPAAYDKDFVNVVRHAGVEILVNGQAASFAALPIAGTTWEAGNLEVSDGIQLIESSEPFGLISYGYANKTAYSYPGGLNAVAAQ